MKKKTAHIKYNPKDKEVCRGKALVNTFLTAALKHQTKRTIEAQEKGEEVYFLTDLESGVPYEVSKEYYEGYMRLMESVKPKLNLPKGKLICFGTGGEVDGKTYWYGMFNKPKNYKIVDGETTD